MSHRFLIIVLVFLSVFGFVIAQEPIDIGEADGIAVSADGSRILSWTEGVATVWDAQSGEALLTLDHGDMLTGAAWKPDGRQVLTWSAESLRVWNGQNGNSLSTFTQEGGVAGAVWSADGTKILNWSENVLTVWDVQSGDELFSQETESTVREAFLSANGNNVLWWSDDNTVTTASLSGDVEVVETAEPDGDVTAADLTEGKWLVSWGRTRIGCPANRSPVLVDRPFLLLTDDDTFVTEDIFTWSLFNFLYTREQTGGYRYFRNEATSSGIRRSIEYKVTTVSPTRIEGTATNFWSDLSCADQIDFVMTLTDEDVICMAGSTRGANMRSGPGTDFSRLGALGAGVPVDVIGQATGSDNFVWWQLSDGGWVREDVVQTVGRCDNVPEVES